MTQPVFRFLLLLGLLGLTLACRPISPPTQPELVAAGDLAAVPTTVQVRPSTPSPVPSATAATTPATTLVTETALPPTTTPAPTATPSQTPPPVGPTEAQQQILATLPDLGPAPVWENTVWLNSEPLHLADLWGKVVIIEFWTYG